MTSKISNKINFKWKNPLKMALSVALDQNYLEDWVFLYSGLSKNNKKSKSYLALYPRLKVVSDNFSDLESSLKKDQKWFGYFGYDLKNQLEELPIDADSKVNLPPLWFINFNLVLEFDHDKKTINCFYSNQDYLEKIPQISNQKSLKELLNQDLKIGKIASNFTKEQYLQKVEDIKGRISKGDLYQANLTRKFYGEIESSNKFAIFLKLNQASPANYSAFLKLENNFIISSSPELFLKIDNKNRVKSFPIKGTAPRFNDKKRDLLSKNNLRNSSKEKAENLMIVDLVRNDFGRSCSVNSVKVKKLFKINSYKTVHHMSSDIVGVKDKKVSNIDVIKNCFPPASMTGTPKIKAMEVCSQLEILKRGVYSGSIGFVSNKECNLSVVIRTIIIRGGIFEFQVGGAITYNSDAALEWQETINKAKGIAMALGLSLNEIRKL